MKDLKFRVWNGKKIINNVIPLSENTYGYFQKEGLENVFRYSFKGNIMQFTGVKDKNNKDIYEGDIIQYKNYFAIKRWWSTTDEIPIIKKEMENKRANYNIFKNTVLFKNGCFQLSGSLNFNDVARGEKFESGSKHSHDYEEKSWHFEVIGNVYQNKNLIEQ